MEMAIESQELGEGACRAKVVGLLGGAFDPPHLGHLVVAGSILNSGRVDELWMVPSGPRPDKRYNAEEHHRVSLLRLMLEDGVPREDGRISCCDVETRAAGSIVGTYELVSALKQDYPQVHFVAIIGSDLLPDLVYWRHGEELRRSVDFLVVARGNQGNLEIPAGYRGVVVPSQFVTDISSTGIRRLVKSRDSTLGLLTPRMRAYIDAHSLYS
jgi:nicotinate-nucleotide adenylyltransferase